MKNHLHFPSRFLKRGIAKTLALVFILGAGVLSFPKDAEAAISYVGEGALGVAGSTNDAAAALPANTEANDILLVFCRSSVSSSMTVSGYTSIAALDHDVSWHEWFWKRHDGSEGTATCVNDCSGTHLAQQFAFRGVITSGDPWNALGTPAAYTGTTDPTTHSAITTGAANSMVVVFIGYNDDDATVGVMTGTDPSAYTEVYAETSQEADGAITMGYALRTSAGSTGSISYDYGTITSLPESAIESSLVLSLNPDSAPPTVTTTSGASAGVGSASVAGDITATGGVNPTVRGFAFGRNSALTGAVSTTTESGSFSTGAFTHNLSGLLAGITYYYRAYATNSGGTGYGGIESFTTGTDTTPSRTMRLFEGFKIKFVSGKIILHQK